jgi:hypothetical protein
VVHGDDDRVAAAIEQPLEPDGLSGGHCSTS